MFPSVQDLYISAKENLDLCSVIVVRRDGLYFFWKQGVWCFKDSLDNFVCRLLFDRAMLSSRLNSFYNRRCPNRVRSACHFRFGNNLKMVEDEWPHLYNAMTAAEQLLPGFVPALKGQSSTTRIGRLSEQSPQYLPTTRSTILLVIE